MGGINKHVGVGVNSRPGVFSKLPKGLLCCLLESNSLAILVQKNRGEATITVTENKMRGIS